MKNSAVKMNKDEASAAILCIAREIEFLKRQELMRQRQGLDALLKQNNRRIHLLERLKFRMESAFDLAEDKCRELELWRSAGTEPEFIQAVRDAIENGTL